LPIERNLRVLSGSRIPWPREFVRRRRLGNQVLIAALANNAS